MAGRGPEVAPQETTQMRPMLITLSFPPFDSQTHRARLESFCWTFAFQNDEAVPGAAAASAGGEGTTPTHTQGPVVIDYYFSLLLTRKRDSDQEITVYLCCELIRAFTFQYLSETRGISV